MGNTATLITNQPDIARWSKTKSGAQWSQLITQPIGVTLSASLGILATAAVNNTWGCVFFSFQIVLGVVRKISSYPQLIYSILSTFNPFLEDIVLTPKSWIVSTFGILGIFWGPFLIATGVVALDLRSSSLLSPGWYPFSAQTLQRTWFHSDQIAVCSFRDT